MGDISSTSTSAVCRYNSVRIIKASRNPIGNCHIIIAETFAIQEAIRKTSQMEYKIL